MKRNMQKALSVILPTLSIIGIVGTSVLAAKAATKASKMISETEKEAERELTTSEKIKIAVPIFAPPVAVGLVTAGCVIGGQLLNHSQQASMVSAYGLLDQAYKKYRGKVCSTYGEEADRDIMKAIAAKDAEQVYLSAPSIGGNCVVSITDDNEPTLLFYDIFSQRFFKTTRTQVFDAIYHLNRNYILRGDACVNEFYDFLGIQPITNGNELGWAPVDEGMYWIDMDVRQKQLADGTDYYAISMLFYPTLDYWNM